ncbi:NADPH-cytochrome P450 reductase [Geranomyces michiganensis]|nr:NADPH-cytochrome P450 reductase [Geranomyces michiganensis]
MGFLGLDTTDVAILTTVGLCSAAYLLFFKRKPAPLQPAVTSAASAVLKTAGASANAKAGKKSLVEKLRSLDNDKQLVFFFGSQTGTAEDLATRLATECTKQYNLPALVCDPEEYDTTEIAEWMTDAKETGDEKKVLFGFFMATYGEGEPTDNAVDFYDWIMAGTGKGEDEGDEEIDDDELMDSEALSGMPYIAFALGNKTYEHYNATGRRLNKRLTRLGAVRVGALGEGDDDESMEEDFLKWKTIAMAEIAKHFELDASASGPQRDAPHIPLFEMVEAPTVDRQQIYYGEHSAKKPRRWRANQENGDDSDSVRYEEVAKVTSVDAKHPQYSRIARSTPLFVDVHDEYGFDANLRLPKAGHKRYQVEDCKVRIERHCLHVDLDIAGSGLKYVTGDHVGVWPVNDDEHVDRLAKALKLTDKELDSVVVLKPNAANMSAANAKIPFPAPCAVRTALESYLEVSACVKQHQLEVLAKYATDPAERDTLFELSENRERYVAIIEKSRKDFAEVLEAFPSVKIPAAVVLGELLPRIAVRYYSISSSSVEQPDKVGITAVMVRYAIPSCHPAHRPEDKEHDSVVIKQGLATSWLQRLHEERTEAGTAPDVPSNFDEPIPLPRFHLPMYIRTSTFKLPKNPRLPVVMVGPGTGVAPFRAFVRERFHLAKTRPDMQVGPTWLFYGCRHPEKDFLYRDEFEAMEKAVASGDVKLDLKIVTAFSRWEGHEKKYVQHRVQEHAALVWDMVGVQGGSFYVCGDAKHMAHDVNLALGNIAYTSGAMKSLDEGKAWVKELKTKGRYLEDVWA